MSVFGRLGLHLRVVYVATLWLRLRHYSLVRGHVDEAQPKSKLKGPRNDVDMTCTWGYCIVIVRNALFNQVQDTDLVFSWRVPIAWSLPTVCKNISGCGFAHIIAWLLARI